MSSTTQQYSIEQFGQMIKQKYPQYKDLDDTEVGKKALEKFPQYKDRVNVSNAMPVAQAPEKGAIETAADTVNNAYEGYKNLPVVKQARELGGSLLGGAGLLIGGAVGAVGTPIANAIKGKPLLENLKENTIKNAGDTGRFAYNIGSEGVAAAPLGIAGKAVNIPLSLAQGYQGVKDVKQGIEESDPAKALQGGLSLGVAAMGARSAVKGKGLLLDQGARNAVIEAAPRTKPLLAPFLTAKEVAAPIVDGVSNAAKKLPIVENFKQGISNLTSGKFNETERGIDPSVMTVLDPRSNIPKVNPKTGMPILEVRSNPAIQEGIYQKFQNYQKVAKRAVENPASPPPLELAGRKAGEALDLYNQKLSKWGELKKAELEKNGDTPVDISRTAEQFRNDLRDATGTNIVKTPTGEYITLDAVGRRSKIALDPADQALIAKISSELDGLGSSNSVRKIDDTVDALQDLLYKRKQNVAIPVNSQVERVMKKAVGNLNAKVKKIAGPTYRKANDKYAYFVDSRNKLNKALGPDEQRAASLAKRVFSPTDGGTRKFFEQIKRDTGIDLIQEATMAKAAGELAGDTRQRGLLESLGVPSGTQPSASGILGAFMKIGKEAAIPSKERLLNQAASGNRPRFK